MYEIRDRRDRFALTSGVTKDISKEDWPFTIDAPAPPFAFGKVVALVTNRELAERIVRLLNSNGKEE